MTLDEERFERRATAGRMHLLTSCSGPTGTEPRPGPARDVDVLRQLREEVVEAFARRDDETQKLHVELANVRERLGAVEKVLVEKVLHKSKGATP